MSECTQRLYPDVVCGEPTDPDQDYCPFHLEPDLWDKADEAYARSKENGFFD